MLKHFINFRYTAFTLGAIYFLLLLLPDFSYQASEVQFSRFLNEYSDVKFVGQIIVAILLIFGQAMLLMQLSYRHQLVPNAYLLPFISFTLFTVLLPGLLSHPELLLGNAFCLLAISEMFAISQEESADRKLIDSGLAIAMASLCYFPVILTMCLMIPAFILIRQFSLREVLVFMSGVVGPYILMGTGIYCFGDWTKWTTNHFDFEVFQNALVIDGISDIAHLVIIGLMVLVGLIGLLKPDSQLSNKARKNRSFLVFMMIESVVLCLFSSDLPVLAPLIFMAAPIAIAWAHLFKFGQPPKLAEYIHFSLMVLVICIQYDVLGYLLP